MLNIFSILVGLVALLIALVGVIPIPLVPMLNWIALPVAILGAAIGMISGRTSGRNLNLLVVLISGLRLFLTGGLI
ncbi:hypothetical protein [Sphingomonas sp. M1-B02]|uniref:hypothetical protein n=1 Tax=Sphingomonas sp. M1-B02 TaxID=3114300 RepID=UPI002240AC4D|nr:hypothetical protein [Sphingomonas sp. S6-11]UZK67622.1 hypothetical protein OKW87_07285 [Sphingomonas sp. S6-11]